MYWVQLFNILSRKIKVLFWCRRADQFAHKSMSNPNRFCPKANNDEKTFYRNPFDSYFRYNENRRLINAYWYRSRLCMADFRTKTPPVKIDACQIWFELSIFSCMTVNRLTRMIKSSKNTTGVKRWESDVAILHTQRIHTKTEAFVWVTVLCVRVTHTLESIKNSLYIGFVQICSEYCDAIINFKTCINAYRWMYFCDKIY